MRKEEGEYQEKQKIGKDKILNQKLFRQSYIDRKIKMTILK